MESCVGMSNEPLTGMTVDGLVTVAMRVVPRTLPSGAVTRTQLPTMAGETRRIPSSVMLLPFTVAARMRPNDGSSVTA